MQILQLLKGGATNDQIARALYISPSTVKNHVASLMINLEAENRTHAVSIAMERGIIGGNHATVVS